MALVLAGCHDEGTVAAANSTLESELGQQAIEVLASFLGVPRDRIRVDTVRAVEWPDSSLGCPQPGEAYLQVVTPGHKITLRADGQVYVVHQAHNHAFVCRQTKALGAVTPQYELVFGEQLVLARRDLARRLGVAETEIRAVSADEATWGDASLGCPEPGQVYAQLVTRGWVLKFRHASREYSYHTDLERTIPCPPITAD